MRTTTRLPIVPVIRHWLRASTLRDSLVPLAILVLGLLVTTAQAAESDLCAKIMASTKPRGYYEAPAEMVATDLNNVGKTNVEHNVFVGDDVYIKINSQAWKKAKIVRASQTREHLTDSFGRHSKCEDLGSDQAFTRPTHLFHVVVFNDRNQPGVEISLTTDAESGEPLIEEVVWDAPEPKYYMPGEPLRSTVRWTYTGVQIPVAELDLTLPEASQIKAQ